MSDFNDFNKVIIDEFRANDGKVGGGFEGAPMVLLHTTGAKSGQPRIAPLVYLSDGDRLVVFGSKGGSPTNPDWYHNLVANPSASVEVGTESYDVDVTFAEGEERADLFARQAKRMPPFAEYEAKAAPRTIPVVILSRK